MVNNEWLNFLSELKSRADIVSVISRYVVLNKRGKTHWACCPFHNEKTPSFTVNEEGRFYHCFGCNASGDVIKFVQQYENVDFLEAVEILAKNVGLQMPSFRSDDAKKRRSKETLYNILIDTAKFYNANLQDQNAKTALNYLHSRNVDKRMQTKFGIGLSLDFEGLAEFLHAKGYNNKDIIAAGVCDTKDGKIYDALAKRLIFPIINTSSQVVGFGGRSLENDSKFAKYKNTNTTEIFNKSKNLYAVNMLKTKKRVDGLDSVIVVEGYMDAISLYHAGFENVVASMGTSLTQEQARLIKRFCDTVYISYDGDGAGKAATLRGLDILKNQGLQVYVVNLPEGCDPDDVITKFGSEKYTELLKQAVPLTDYKLNILYKSYNFDTDNASLNEQSKRNYVNAALVVIKQLDNLIEQESYLRLLQSQSGFSLDYLKRQVAEIDGNQQEAPPPAKPQAAISAYDKALRYIIACLIKNMGYAQPTDELQQAFTKPDYAAVYNYIVESRNSGNKTHPDMLYTLLDDQDEAADIISIELDDQEKSTRYYNDCYRQIEKANIEEKMRMLEKQHTDCADEQMRNKLASEINALSIKLINLKRR